MVWGCFKPCDYLIHMTNFYRPNINTSICHISKVLLPKLIVYGVTLVSVYFLTGEKSSCHHSCRLSKFHFDWDLFSIRKNIHERDGKKCDEQEKTGRT